MFFKKLILTIGYVTSIPLSGLIKEPVEEKDLHGLAKYLPLAGALIGGMLACLSWILVLLNCDNLIGAALVAVAWLAITGSLHMDGLMDTADGIFSHQNKARMLEIMQDSRVGNFGVLWGIAIFVLKLASLSSLFNQPGMLVPLIILTPISARWTEVYCIARFNYAKPEGKGKVWHDTTKSPNDLFLGLIPLVMAGAILALYFRPSAIMVPIVATMLAGIVSAHWLNKILGGQTGDTYGAVVELAEVSGLVLTAISINLLN